MRFKKGSLEAKEYMANIRSKKGKKKGKGMMNDLMENVKKEGENLIREKGKQLVNNLVDKGVDVLKKKIRGKGVKDLLKTGIKTAINLSPMPEILKPLASTTSDNLIDNRYMKGKGLKNNNLLIGNKTIMVNKNMAKKQNGGALKTLGAGYNKLLV